MKMTKRPIIILGAPRAGTSILGRIIQQQPGFVHAKEPRLVWRFGNDGRSDQLGAVHASEKVVSYIQHYFSKLVIAENGNRLLEKTPSNSLRVPFIERIFPDAQYIHVTRNGFDAAASIKSYWQNSTRGTGQGRIGDKKSILQQRLAEIHPTQIPYYAGEFLNRLRPRLSQKPAALWGPRLAGLKDMVRDLDLLEVAGMQWRTCTEHAAIHGRALGSDRYFEFRLEDLNDEVVDQIFDFLGEKSDKKVWSHFSKTFDPNMTNSRRATMTEADRKILRPILEPTMSWLGYSEPK